MAWNQNSDRKPVARPAGKGGKSGLIIVSAIVLVLLAGIGFYFTSRDTATPVKVKKGAKPRQIETAESKPVVQAKEEKSSEKPLTNWEIRHLDKSQTNRLSHAEYEYWKMFNPIAPFNPKAQPPVKPGKYRIFENRADNEIAFVLSTEPGTMIFGRSSFGEGFTKRFLKSIVNPIVIKDTDSDYEKALKRAVIDAKIELKARYDAGEDIGKVMDDSRSELQKLGRYKEELRRMAQKSILKEGATEADVDDTLKAVNKMLAEKGIAPMTLNGLSRRAIKMQSEMEKQQ